MRRFGVYKGSLVEPFKKTTSADYDVLSGVSVLVLSIITFHNPSGQPW